MFQQLKNIDTAFKHIRLFNLVLILAYTVLCCYVIYTSKENVDRAHERIYLIVNGKVFTATASTREENLPVEARDHIKVFHSYFFTLSPDEKAIEASIEKALYLGDNSAKAQYDALVEEGFYSSLISANVSQEVSCDSVQVNTASYPYYFRYFGRQRIIRTSAIITRSLISEGYLRTVQRSDHNPHGFLIEKWQVLENKHLSTKKRD